MPRRTCDGLRPMFFFLSWVSLMARFVIVVACFDDHCVTIGLCHFLIKSDMFGCQCCALIHCHVMNCCVQWPLHGLLVCVSLFDHRMTS